MGADIVGQDKANPIASILSVAMLLRYSLNQPNAANRIEQAVAQVLAKGYRSADIFQENGGSTKQVSTTQMGELIRQHCE